MNDETLSAAERARVAQLVDARGDRKAAAALGLGIDTLLRILANRPIRRVTVRAVRAMLTELPSETRVAG